MIALMLFTSLLASASGCTSYAGVTTQGDKAIVVKNNVLLAGLFFRRVFVGKNTEQGLDNCQRDESP